MNLTLYQVLHVVNRQTGVDPLEQANRSKIIDDRLGLLVKDRQSGADGGLVVIFAVH